MHAWVCVCMLIWFACTRIHSILGVHSGSGKDLKVSLKSVYKQAVLTPNNMYFLATFHSEFQWNANSHANIIMAAIWSAPTKRPSENIDLNGDVPSMKSSLLVRRFNSKPNGACLSYSMIRFSHNIPRASSVCLHACEIAFVRQAFLKA